MNRLHDIIQECGYALTDARGATMGRPAPDAFIFCVLKELQPPPLLGFIHRRKRHWRVARFTEDKGRWRMTVYGRTFLPEMRKLAGRIGREVQVYCVVRLGTELPHPETLRPDFTTG